MDDRLKETLSAMMDDEADELSVRRLLSHAEQDQVCSQWQRWQQIRDLMHQGGVAPEAVDVSAGVRDVLNGSAAPSPMETVRLTSRRERSWHWPAVAMVTLAAVIGFGAGAGWESTEDGGVMAAASVSEDQDDPRESAGQPVPEVALQGLDEEQREHLSRYLLEHAQHNSVGAGRGSVGYARVVSASGPGY